MRYVIIISILNIHDVKLQKYKYLHEYLQLSDNFKNSLTLKEGTGNTAIEPRQNPKCHKQQPIIEVFVK